MGAEWAALISAIIAAAATTATTVASRKAKQKQEDFAKKEKEIADKQAYEQAREEKRARDNANRQALGALVNAPSTDIYREDVGTTQFNRPNEPDTRKEEMTTAVAPIVAGAATSLVDDLSKEYAKKDMMNRGATATTKEPSSTGSWFASRKEPETTSQDMSNLVESYYKQNPSSYYDSSESIEQKRKKEEELTRQRALENRLSNSVYANR